MPIFRIKELMGGMADHLVPRPSRQGQGVVVAEADITLQVDGYSRELHALQKHPEAALGVPARLLLVFSRRDLMLAALHPGLVAVLIHNRTPGSTHPVHAPIFGRQP